MADSLISDLGGSAEIRGASIPAGLAGADREENPADQAGPRPGADTREDLRRKATLEANRWKLSGRRRRQRRLREMMVRWREVSQRIESAIHALRNAKSDPADSPASAQWLLENSRLLRTALRETREAIGQAQSLPQIEDPDQNRRTPRAYAASAGFLRAAGFAFDEHSFLVYFQAIQEPCALDMEEIWTLRPLLQLVLLERIAQGAARLRAGSGRRSVTACEPRGERPAPIPKLIRSLRDIVNADWKDLFERLSRTDAVLREDLSYPCMDFESRDLYRGAVQELARCSGADEVIVARKAIALASAAGKQSHPDARVTERRSHVGYYLLDKGRKALEEQIGYNPPFSKRIADRVLQWPAAFYLTGIGLLAFAIMAFVLSGLRPDAPAAQALLLLLLPAVGSAVEVMNQLIAFWLPPRTLPRLDFSRSIPESCTTMVAVPTLLLNEQEVHQMVRDLEIRYLGNRDSHLHFALLTDLPDSSRPFDASNRLIRLCSKLIEGLNEKYTGAEGGSFFHFHRHRLYNPSEGVWMGWERKRGKLLDFNNLLRGRDDRFPVKIGDLSILPKVRYVITLDADTQLPRESAHRLVGALAHPLNQAIVDPRTNTVVEGYGILQPRVGVSVRSANRSRLANIFSEHTGFDIYTKAVSNAYQDLAGEGSFTGKGIYEVDVFQRVLSGRFPLNAILSHDLIEGAYARTGLISDVEVIDDYPSHFSAYSRRKHRWVRGDWQIMRWLLPRVPDGAGRIVRNPISLLSRWKILDNLRRSLHESAVFALLLAGWFSLPGGAFRWTAAVLALLLIPAYFRLLLSVATALQAKNIGGALREAGETFVADQVSVFLMLALLAHQVLVTLDAIIRTAIRLAITRRRLLEWETTAQSEAGARRMQVDLYLKWTPAVPLAVAALIELWRPQSLPVAAPILALWACSGILARWLNRPPQPEGRDLTGDDEQFLRQATLRTWRFFRSLSNAENHWLIPDNLQEEPHAVAQRMSPTNLGLLLNARVAAYQLGYLTLPEFVVETERTMASAGRLQRCHGHFFNWYDIQSLRPLEPLFISTVDSGNLACSLWTLKQACLQWIGEPIVSERLWAGIQDHLRMLVALGRAGGLGGEAAEALGQLEAAVNEAREGAASWLQALPAVEQALARVEGDLTPEARGTSQDLAWWVQESRARLENLRSLAETWTPWLLPEHGPLLRRPELEAFAATAQGVTPGALPRFVAGLERQLMNISKRTDTDPASGAEARALAAQLSRCPREAEQLQERLRMLAEECDAWVRQMDFRLLYNSRRKVLSVGYHAAEHRLEESCYELLASEARSAAFVAIAKGDAPQESWFHLGRTLTACGGERALLSWSGTMFEYLMPALWMKTLPNTILDQSLRTAVACQRRVSKRKRVPWGISESACSRRGASGHYQYHAFGLRELALRPAMHRGFVVSPYAAFLALSVDASAAVGNLRWMQRRGWTGPFGFYEAADFSSSRGVNGQRPELVRCWMAHHQGMILVSVCNLLAGAAARQLFHAEPMVAATERLLQERSPRTVLVERLEEWERG